MLLGYQSKCKLVESNYELVTKNGQKTNYYMAYYVIFSFMGNKMQAIIVLRLGFTFQSSLMLIAFLCIMTFFKSSVLTKKILFFNNSFKIYKSRKYATLKMSVLHFKPSNICYFFAITEEKATATKEAIVVTQKAKEYTVFR